jgi:hypothetical protein
MQKPIQVLLYYHQLRSILMLKKCQVSLQFLTLTQATKISFHRAENLFNMHKSLLIKAQRR